MNNRDKEGAFIRANEAAQLNQQNLLQAKDNLLAEEDTEELDAVQIEAEDLEQEGIDVSIHVLSLLCQTRKMLDVGRAYWRWKQDGKYPFHIVQLEQHGQLFFNLIS